jgi:hypothetical protein
MFAEYVCEWGNECFFGELGVYDLEGFLIGEEIV